jgi:hypothetical protein
MKDEKRRKIIARVLADKSRREHRMVGGTEGLVKYSCAPGTYLGGHSVIGPGSIFGMFILNATGLGIGELETPQHGLLLSEIESVEISGGEISKSKAGPVLVFGVLGLAAKGTKYLTYVTVHGRDGEVAYFSIDSVEPMAARATLVPLLKQAGIRAE